MTLARKYGLRTFAHIDLGQCPSARRPRRYLTDILLEKRVEWGDDRIFKVSHNKTFGDVL